MLRSFALPVFVAVIVSSCVTPAKSADVDPNDAKAVKQGTTLRVDKHRGSRALLGPSVRTDRHGYSLSGVFHDGGVDVFLSIQATFKRWAFLHSVYSRGRKMDTGKFSRDVLSNGSVFEGGAIYLSRSDVQRLAREGFEGKAFGKRGSLLIAVPAPYFAGFLAALKREESANPASRSTSPRPPPPR